MVKNESNILMLKKLVKRFLPQSVLQFKNNIAIKDSSNVLIYIHIGKCGGASLWEAINKSPILKEKFMKIHKVHVEKPPVLKNARYIVVIRNPIKRAISAFNWRYRLVVEKQTKRHRNDDEYEVLKKYGTLNNLAEALYVDDALDENVSKDFQIIHHLKESISFYLKDALDYIKAEQVFCVLSTETLNDDIYKNLAVIEVARAHENAKNTGESKKFLSDKACENLRRYLCDDYQCIEKLLTLRNTTSCDPSLLLS